MPCVKEKSVHAASSAGILYTLLHVDRTQQNYYYHSISTQRNINLQIYAKLHKSGGFSERKRHESAHSHLLKNYIFL